MAGYFFKLLLCLLILRSAQVHGDILVNITFKEGAVGKGAVCLDGSAPAYSYLEGSGNGARSWMVFIAGGGWCASKSNCYNRSQGTYGINFSGILDNDETNWHKVYVLYCDGSSFMSDVKNPDPDYNITYRGARIYNAVIEELLLKGMGSAHNAILTGGSSGALTAIKSGER